MDDMSLEKEITDEYLDNKWLYNVQIELTNKCNWRCRHCYLPEHSDYGLSTEKVHEILIDARKLGAFELIFTGGDIFLRNDILDLIKIARGLGYSVILFTNASLLNEEMIKKLADYYVSLVSCTIFFMNNEIHDYFTKTKGSLRKTIENIRCLKKYGINVEVKTIISNINFLEWKAIKNFCESEGFLFAIDHDIFIQNDKNKSPADFRITPTQFMMECKAYDTLREFEPKHHDCEELACSAIKNGLFINSYGKVYPCPKFLYEIGDINKEKLINVWEKNNKFEKIQDIKWKELPECKSCEVEKYCTRCPGTAFLEQGSEYSCSLMSLEKAKIRKFVYENN